MLGSLCFETCLRVYGHPQLLRIAEAINGEDFTPFNEALFIKEPGIGAAVSWHQDGTTRWDSLTSTKHPRLQLHGAGLWQRSERCVGITGSHKTGKVDIKGLVATSGSERIDGTMPLVATQVT